MRPSPNPASRRLPGATPAVPVAPALPLRSTVPAVPVAVPEGRVIEVGLGEVVIDLGRRHGIRDGHSIELVDTRTEKLGSERAERRTVLAVGVVTVVAESTSRVRLGLNERVPVGARARLVTRRRRGGASLRPESAASGKSR